MMTFLPINQISLFAAPTVALSAVPADAFNFGNAGILTEDGNALQTEDGQNILPE